MPQKTYKVGEDIYDIDDADVSSFLKDMPKAVEIKSFVHDKDTFDIPVNEVPDFLKDFPKAKLIGAAEEKPVKPASKGFTTELPKYEVPTETQFPTQGVGAGFTVPAAPVIKPKPMPKTAAQDLRTLGTERASLMTKAEALRPQLDSLGAELKKYSEIAAKNNNNLDPEDYDNYTKVKDEYEKLIPTFQEAQKKDEEFNAKSQQYKQGVASQATKSFDKLDPLKRTKRYSEALNNVTQRYYQNVEYLKQATEAGDEDAVAQIKEQIKADSEKGAFFKKAIEGQQMIAAQMEPDTWGNRLNIGIYKTLGSALLAEKGLTYTLAHSIGAIAGVDPKVVNSLLQTRKVLDGGASDQIAAAGKYLSDFADERSGVRALNAKFEDSAFKAIEAGEYMTAADLAVGAFAESFAGSAMYLTGVGTAIATAGMVGQEITDAQKNGEEITPEVILAGNVKAALEIVTERMWGVGATTRKLIAKLGKEGAEQAVKEITKNIFKKFGQDVFEESAGEAVNQFGSNLADYYIKGKKFNKDGTPVNIWEGVPDAAIIGLAGAHIQGGPVTVLEHVVDKAQAKKYEEMKAKSQELTDMSLGQESPAVAEALEAKADKLNDDADKVAEEQNKIGSNANPETMDALNTAHSKLDELTASLEQLQDPIAIEAVQTAIDNTQKQVDELSAQAKSEALLSLKTKDNKKMFEGRAFMDETGLQPGLYTQEEVDAAKESKLQEAKPINQKQNEKDNEVRNVQEGQGNEGNERGQQDGNENGQNANVQETNGKETNGQKEVTSAVQEPGTGEVLQRQSQEAGVPGSERTGVEQGQQGQEVAEKGSQKEVAPPTEEQLAKDLKEKNFVTFTYNDESEVPEQFKDKISSSGIINGKKQVKVTLLKSEADYQLSKQQGQEVAKEGGQEEVVPPTEGVTTTLPAASKYGQPREMVYKDGKWQQKIGREFTEVSTAVQKEAEAAFAATPQSKSQVAAKGASMSSKSSIDDIKSRVTDAAKVAVINMAQKAVKTLKSVLPNFDIVVHETPGSYNESMAEVNGRAGSGGNFAFVRNADGTYSGRIDINLGAANARTVAHEVAHGVMLAAFGDKPALFNNFKNKIASALKGETNAKLEKFISSYSDMEKPEEYLAELTGYLADNQDSIAPSTWQKVAAIINDIVSKLTNGAIKPFQDLKNTKEIIEFFDNISSAIREGQDVKNLKTKAKGVSAKITSKSQLGAMPMSAKEVLYTDEGALRKPEKKTTNSSVANRLEEAARNYWGGQIVTSNDITEEQEDKIVENGVEEAVAALEASGKNAADWYSTAIEVAMKVAGVIHPELSSLDSANKYEVFAREKDPVSAAQLAMRMALAITSQNLNVDANTKYAEEQFDFFKKNGKFDYEKEYGAKAPAITSNMLLANVFVDAIGLNELEKFVASEFTVADLEKAASEAIGKKVKISGLRNDIINGAAIFGPKIGQGFLQNLMGNFNPVTIDLWMRRTWGRWTGDVVGDGITESRMARFLNSYKQAVKDLGIKEQPAILSKYKPIQVLNKSNKLEWSMSDKFTEELESNPSYRKDLNEYIKEISLRGNTLYKAIHDMPMSSKLLEEFVSGSKTYAQVANELIKNKSKLKEKYSEYSSFEKSNKRKPLKLNEWIKSKEKASGFTLHPSNDQISERKPIWANASKNIVVDLNPIDIPTDKDRKVISRIVNKIREGMADKGYVVTNADVQAILWYPEKDIWAKLRGEEESNLKLSYDDQFIKIAKERGLGKQAEAAAEQVRSERAARASEGNGQKPNESIRKEAVGNEKGVVKSKSQQNEKTKGLQYSETEGGIPMLSESGGGDYASEGKVQREEGASKAIFNSVVGVWNKFKNIQFSGTTKVKDASDVAHIMQLLENKSVEQSFAVHVDKSGKSHVQFLSIGGLTGTVIDPKAVLAGAKKFKAVSTYLVHNHPSGKLVPSQADLNITEGIRKGFAPLGIKLEHIIMDTFSKEYVHIDEQGLYSVKKRDLSKADNIKLTTYVLDEQQIVSEPISKVINPNDAANFIQQLRFTAMPKNAVMLLSNDNKIIGNYVFQGEVIDYNQLTSFIAGSGVGNSVIFYGNQNNADQVKGIKGLLKGLDVNVLDYIVVDSDSSSIQQYYNSVDLNSRFGETQSEYGTDSVAKSQTEEAKYEELSVEGFKASEEGKKAAEIAIKMETAMAKAPSLKEKQTAKLSEEIETLKSENPEKAEVIDTIVNNIDAIRAQLLEAGIIESINCKWG